MASRNGYVECSKCGKFFEQGTLATEFQGYGAKRVIPQRRWHSASECRVVRFGIEKPVCTGCGGEKKEQNEQEPLWKRAKSAWNSVTDSGVIAMRGKRGG